MTNVLCGCDVCGADVVMVTGSGRSLDIGAGVTASVPVDFPIATCIGCGETYLTTAEMLELERIAFMADSGIDTKGCGNRADES